MWNINKPGLILNSPQVGFFPTLPDELGPFLTSLSLSKHPVILVFASIGKSDQKNWRVYEDGGQACALVWVWGLGTEFRAFTIQTSGNYPILLFILKF